MRLFALIVSTLFVIATASMAASGVQLVTEQEAAYPDEPYWGMVAGAPTPAPGVKVVSPSLESLIRSPFELNIKFEAHSGARIDPDSIRVTYGKVPRIDVTQRIKAFISADEIRIAEAALPAGKHPFRVDVKDDRGRESASLYFWIEVAR
jgi:hypothetical protein